MIDINIVEQFNNGDHYLDDSDNDPNDEDRKANEWNSYDGEYDGEEDPVHVLPQF